jgi:dihydroorotase
MVNTRLDGSAKLLCELTLKDGKIVYDLSGISADVRNETPSPRADEASRWTTFAPKKASQANGVDVEH